MLPEFTPRIPTTRKAHLPPGFAYPIGSGAVSDVFIGLPNFAKFTLSFSNVTPLLRPPLRVPGFPVLRLTYSNYPQYVPRGQSPDDIRKTFGGERWHVEVLPTHIDRRLIVQQLMIEQGIPMLRDWLIGPDAPTGVDQTRRVIEVWYFYDTGAVKLHPVDLAQDVHERQA